MSDGGRPPRRGVVDVIGRIVRSFLRHQAYDVAGTLTFYSVLSLVPAMVALVALLGLLGQAEESVAVVVEILEPLTTEDLLTALIPILESLASASGAGSAFTIGVAVGLWSASAYVAAFGRAMNRVYDVPEGRPVWLVRPAMVVLTLVEVALIASLLVMIVVTGPIARGIGDVIGLEAATVRLWDIAKWPAVALVSMVVVALLYQVTPNVRLPRFRLLSVGSVVAIGTWVVAAAGFAWYVGTLGNYDATYGSLAGAVVSLVFLWISNMALLAGAEIDLEIARGRQLRAGIEAEEHLQLAPRATRRTDRQAEWLRRDVEVARRVRLAASASTSDPEGSTAAQTER